MASTAFFCVNPIKQGRFYEAVLGGNFSMNNGVPIIKGESFEVLLLEIPDEIAKEIVIASPPAAREEVTIKPVFEVSELDEALRLVVGAGGVVTERTFTLDEFEHVDVLDTEGNVIQLKSRSFSKS
jgi:predicted enzyme related to lactoylglutathione lyase